MESPAFSKFRDLMDRWDASFRLFEESDLCLFFKKDGVLYGATEDGRINFARIKNPESKEDEAWSKDANFSAYDLEKTSDGNKSMSLFSASDVDKLKMLSQEQAEKELEKKGKKMPAISDDEGGRTLGEK